MRNEREWAIAWNCGDDYWDNGVDVEWCGSLEEVIELVREDARRWGYNFDEDDFRAEVEEDGYAYDEDGVVWMAGLYDRMSL